MTNEQFKQIQSTIPSSPGVYKFLDKTNTLLYVGKAKNIRKRVLSYFRNKYDNAKTRLLVKKTFSIEYTIVEHEKDALLLENLLIKENQPKYNIQLRDDKTYPHICIKNERFPRIFLTRTLVPDGSEYLGPYTSVKKVRSIIQLLRNIFPLRTCSLNLSQSNIDKDKYKVCLEYHIGNCKGPCENLQSEEDYNHSIEHIRNILKGKVRPVILSLKEEMNHYADIFEFEKANLTKEKIELLENYKSNSTIVNPSINNVDVFSIVDNQNSAVVNHLKVVEGSVIQTKSIELKKQLDEKVEDILVFAITELTRQFKDSSTEFVVPFKISLPDSQIKITVPQRGEKRKLLQLSSANANQYKIQRENKIPSKERKNVSLEVLKSNLRLEELPVHIECIDNSNFQGSNPVASVVVFKYGKPSKKDYRHFNIKTVVGPNDFASMEEIVFRRYSAFIKEQQSLPQLIIIDGGKGQLNAALKSLERLSLNGKIAIVGIAKKLEELYVPNDPVPLHIDKRSAGLKLIQQLRNEAHRFAITFHRTKSKNSLLKTNLSNIPGIGAKTSEALLKVFKSEKKIKQATLEELASCIGLAKAKKILAYYDGIN